MTTPRSTPRSKPTQKTKPKTSPTSAPAVVSSPVPSLDGKHIFVTGGTGFVGQAILERLLSSYTDTRMTVLVRGKANVSSQSRLEGLLRKPVFASWIERIGVSEAKRQFAERVTAHEGSLNDVGTLPDDIDIVLHSASTVSFDPPIDEAFETNVGGAYGVYGALLASGSDPHVVHISTAYVGGVRKGIVPEASLTHDVDWRAEYEAAKSARSRVELESRQPEALRAQLARARGRHGKTGPQAVARFAETAREEWVRERLVDYGRMRAQSLGWTDVYTLTKAFGERAAEELWAQAGHRLSVIRPSIIESALRHPFPGWIDGYKVADPLIIAYGRGQLPDFPGLPDSVLDIIPVDFVVNAALAAAARDPRPAEPRYFHVSSGASNPLPFHRMYENVHQYFTEHPLPGDKGDIPVPVWKFPGGQRVERALAKREWQASKAERVVERLPATPKTRAWLSALSKGKHGLKKLRAFTELYRAYVQTEIIFDDTNTRDLLASLPDDQRNTAGFDVADIDWERYLQEVHMPAVTTLTRAFGKRPAARERSAPKLPERSDIVAIFDLEGTVLESNLVKQYLMLWAGSVPRSRVLHDLADFTFSLPKYFRAERRDRGEFIRTFMRRYKGFKVSEIERLVRGSFGRAVLRRAMPDALLQVQAHRDAGHRTVLVTGTIDLMVEPFLPFFDEVVAGSMHVRNGVLTGFLDDPPLVDEARAAWLRHYAARHGVDLSHSYGYGDSHADLVWLELLGNPSVVNPDTDLYRHAMQKHWSVLDWKGGSGVVPGPPHAAMSSTAIRSTSGSESDTTKGSERAV